MNTAAALSFFAGTAILALMTAAIMKRLPIQTPNQPRSTARSFVIGLFHFLGFVFLFVPVVIWQLVAFPLSSGILALMALVVTLRGYRQSPVTSRRTVLALVLVSTSMWLCYGIYEHQMQQWARTVIAPIRVDLLVLAPLLYVSTISLFRFWSWTNRQAQTKVT